MNIVKEPIDALTEIEYQFSVIVTDISATAPDDYLAQQKPSLFDPERQRLQYNVTINDDSLIEGTETFQLKLLVSEQPHFLLGNITTVTVTITDDEKGEDEGKVY